MKKISLKPRSWDSLGEGLKLKEWSLGQLRGLGSILINSYGPGDQILFTKIKIEITMKSLESKLRKKL